jgi:hypothetical protein
MDDRTEALIMNTALPYALEGKPKNSAYRACMKATGYNKLEESVDLKIHIDNLELCVDKVYTQVKASRVHN